MKELSMSEMPHFERLITLIYFEGSWINEIGMNCLMVQLGKVMAVWMTDH